MEIVKDTRTETNRVKTTAVSGYDEIEEEQEEQQLEQAEDERSSLYAVNNLGETADERVDTKGSSVLMEEANPYLTKMLEL